MRSARALSLPTVVSLVFGRGSPPTCLQSTVLFDDLDVLVFLPSTSTGDGGLVDGDARIAWVRRDRGDAVDFDSIEVVNGMLLVAGSTADAARDAERVRSAKAPLYGRLSDRRLPPACGRLVWDDAMGAGAGARVDAVSSWMRSTAVWPPSDQNEDWRERCGSALGLMVSGCACCGFEVVAKTGACVMEM